jgi:hypothetical protein
MAQLKAAQLSERVRVGAVDEESDGWFGGSYPRRAIAQLSRHPSCRAGLVADETLGMANTAP